MTLNEVLEQRVFAVAGSTLTTEKPAGQIKAGLTARGRSVYGVGKELASFNEIPEEIDVIDLCIRSDRGLELMKENRKPFKCVVVQPGAGSPELLQWMDENHIPYLEGCLLRAMAEADQA